MALFNQAFVVFCSPAGSTGHVARVIPDSLKKNAIPVQWFDLGAGEDPSMMWQSDQPVGQGHPNTADDLQVRMLVDKVVERIKSMKPDPLPLTVLDYQPDEISADIKNKLDQPWMIIPKTVDEEKCSECGTCVDVCPVKSVSLDPGPVFIETSSSPTQHVMILLH